MMERDNVQLVQQGYAAFGHGDIPGVLALCTDDIEWTQPGPAELPATGTYHGKEGVADFFRRLGEHLTFARFEPYDFVAQGDKVIALIHITATPKASGEQFTSEDAHVFTFRDGKIMRFVVYTDTAAQVTAYHGQHSSAAA